MQSNCEATDVEQRDVSLAALDTAQVASGQAALQRELLLREALCLAKVGESRAKEASWIDRCRCCALCHERNRMYMYTLRTRSMSDIKVSATN